MNLLELMMRDLPFTGRELSLLISTAPLRYKTHFIEKRNNRGKREIAQPTAEVKLIQRWVISKILRKLPVHAAATAYVKGKGIADHAAIHAKSKYLLKLDFREFFPSIKGTDLIRHLRKHTELSQEDLERLAKILFRHNQDQGGLRLSIGAPSSPLVSNLLMFDFDQKLQSYCLQNSVRYTRYADDLALSTNVPHILDKTLEFIQMTCRQIDYPKLTLNSDKTVFTSKKFSRQLTGLILTNDGDVSLGREKKRLIRAMTYRASQQQLNVEEINHLKGLLAFAYSIEPEFIESLKRMIGKNQMFQLFPVGAAIGKH